MTTLRELKPGERGRIISVGGEGSLRQHFLDMGVIPGEEVAVVKYAPMGDPVELLVQGYRLTLRLADAEKIQVDRETSGRRKHQEVAAASAGAGTAAGRPASDPSPEHPGLGEGGRFHPKGAEIPCPRARSFPSPWWATRTAAKRPCSIS